MSKRSIRNLPGALGLSICLIATLLALQVPASRAAPRRQAAPAAPETKGSIAGVVRGPAGAPLEAISVVLQRAIFPSSWNWVEQAMTDAQGRYAIDQLAPGTYQVLFYDGSGVYAQQYYAQAITAESATPLAINGNALAGIDAQLAVGGSIEGSVPGVAEGYGLIGAYAEAGGEWQLVAQAPLLPAQGSLDALHYKLRSLPPAPYHVCAIYGSWFSGSAPCYNRIGGGVAHATGVTLAAGEVVTGIDLAAHGFVDAATIRGTVTSSSGEPLAGITVAANAGDPDLVFGRLAVTVAQTDAAGRYVLGDLAAGNYVLDFKDENGPYLPQFYRGAASFEQAEVVSVQPNDQRGHVDARLALGGVISGSILFAGDFAPPAATVAAFVANPPPNTTLPSFPGVYDPASGRYVIKPLPPGIYDVGAGATDPANSNLSFYQFYGGPGEATIHFIVTEGSRYEGIDFRLAEGAYEGTITGTVTGESGQPLGGIRVDLLPWGGAGRVPLVYAFTDATGRFRFEGLADGAYFLRYVDPAGFYAPEYWSNQPIPSRAWPIHVAGGQPNAAGDATLARSGWIRGQIRNVTGAAVKGAQVTIRLDYEVLTSGQSGADGAYDSGPLPAGDYTVCADGYTAGMHASACAGYEYGAAWPGLPVTVEAGAEAGVDLVLGYVPQYAHKRYLPAVSKQWVGPGTE